MSTQLPRSERPRKQSVKKVKVSPTQPVGNDGTTEMPVSAVKMTREQRYLAPVGRHSQQSERRAQESAAAGGHATEKEQLAHERTVVEAKFILKTQQRQKQREQKSSAKVQLPAAALVVKAKAPVTPPA